MRLGILPGGTPRKVAGALEIAGGAASEVVAPGNPVGPMLGKIGASTIASAGSGAKPPGVIQNARSIQEARAQNRSRMSTQYGYPGS